MIDLDSITDTQDDMQELEEVVGLVEQSLDEVFA